MEVFFGYFWERIFIFFVNESPIKIQGTVHASQHVFKRSTKHIKMIETLKYSVFQAQFMIKILTICRVFLVYILASECAFLQ